MSSNGADRPTTSLATSLLYLWAFSSFLYISDFHPVAIALAPLGAVAYWQRERYPLNRRNVAAGIVLTLLLTGIVFFTAKSGGYLLGGGALSLAVFAAGCLISMTPLRSSEPIRLAIPGLSGFLLICCTLTINVSATVVIAFVALVLIALAFRERLSLRLSWRLLAPLLLMVVLAGGLATAASWSETRLLTLLNMFSVVPSSGVRFPPSSTLNSIQQWGNSDIVALRVYGDSAPPYLVGRSFVEYDPGSFWNWKPFKQELKPSGTIASPLLKGKTLQLYPDRPTGEPALGEAVLVEFPDGGSGFTFYTPRHFSALAVDLPQLHRYSDGLWQVLSRDTFSGSYCLYPYPDGWVRQGAVEPLSEQERARHLALPEGVTPEVARLAQEVAGAYAAPEEKARRITTFFQTKFEYGYDYPFTSSSTALEEFLLQRPPAHCEFFATSTALMLRAQGVPTRYINGFVVQERSFDDSYYVIRLKHAHAWVEAYLPELGWTTFDPTPPGVLDSPESKNPSRLDGLLEWLSNSWRKFLAWFRLSPWEMYESLKAFVGARSKQEWFGLLALLGAAWGGRRWWVWRRRRGRRSAVETPFIAGRHEQLTPLLEACNNAIEPPEARRQPWETTEQWLERYQRSGRLEPELAELSQATLRRYQAARYGKQPPSPEELAALRDGLEELRRAFEGNSLQARERPTP